MAATETFQDVLRTVQTSNLNYKMEISHFSATIHLKNSFLTDPNGNPLSAPFSSNMAFQNEELARKILQLEAVIKSLQQTNANAVDDCEEIRETNKHLESKVNILHCKLDAAELKVTELNKQVKNERTIKKEPTENQTDLKREILELTSRNETLDNLTISLHSQLIQFKEKAKKELLDSRKELKKEIKSWRKDLGEEVKKNIKLEKKLEDLLKKEPANDEKVDQNAVSPPFAASTSSNVSPPSASVLHDSRTVCTICAEPINYYVPKYFLGIEINPACQNCQDSSLSSDFDEDFEAEEPFT